MCMGTGHDRDDASAASSRSRPRSIKPASHLARERARGRSSSCREMLFSVSESADIRDPFRSCFLGGGATSTTREAPVVVVVVVVSSTCLIFVVVVVVVTGGEAVSLLRR